MNDAILNRKGARKLADIPAEILQLLNEGKIETVNLTEWLAIDHAKLIENNFLPIGIPAQTIQLIIQKIDEQKKPTTMSSTKLIGLLLYQELKEKADFYQIFENLRTHLSDAIRCYSPYLISLNPKIAIEEKFNLISPLVADKHFGVREIVWMAIRPEIDKNLLKSIHFLSTWADHEDENIRRFTTEATRPRGVWCKHIEPLKEQPELALPILEKLKSDPSKYVQDSVGNWLNDASKSRPDFIIKLCERWEGESPIKSTLKIIKRARRTIDKK